MDADRAEFLSVFTSYLSPIDKGGFRFVSLAVSQPLLSRYSMAEAQEYDEELADYEEAEEEDSTKTAAAADSA